MISPRQCRAARAWLGLDQRQFGTEAKCNRDTLRRFEAGIGQLRPATEAAIRAAFEARGVSFTFTSAGRPLGIEVRDLNDG
jgi:hypothetical protein